MGTATGEDPSGFVVSTELTYAQHHSSEIGQMGLSTGKLLIEGLR